MLKIDLHLHTCDDPEDYKHVKYSAQELIDLAQQKGYEVLSITNHNVVTDSEDLRDYAAQRGILLIPGVEKTIEGKHVLLINFPQAREINTFSDILKYKSENNLVIAPHPYFPSFYSLFSRLTKNIKIFDAIEYSHYYHRSLNLNRFAVKVARLHGFPLIGTSDAHFLFQLDNTYTLVQATKETPAVIQAIKEGHCQIATKPLSVWQMIKISRLFGSEMMRRFKSRNEKNPSLPSPARLNEDYR